MPDPVAALLLDLDGTLVDSEGFHRQVIANWFASRGWPATDTLLASFTGRRADDVFASVPGPWVGEDIPQIMDELWEQVALLPSPELVPGASDLLQNSSVPLALVTSANEAWARRCLGDLFSRFAVVVTRDDVTRGKPDPEPYSLGTRMLGISPSACLAVEDAPAGVASAVAADIGFVVAVSGTVPDDQLHEAHLVVPSLLSVHRLLWPLGPFGAPR